MLHAFSSYDRSSTYTLNRYGDNIPHCLTPLLTVKGAGTLIPPSHHHRKVNIKSVQDIVTVELRNAVISL